MKATYGEVIVEYETGVIDESNGVKEKCRELDCREIFKDPITDDGTKRSKKGLLQVTYDDDMNIVCLDQCTKEQEKEGLLKTVFKDGVLFNETSLEKIRQKLKS